MKSSGMVMIWGERFWRWRKGGDEGFGVAGWEDCGFIQGGYFHLLKRWGSCDRKILKLGFILPVIVRNDLIVKILKNNDETVKNLKLYS